MKDHAWPAAGTQLEVPGVCDDLVHLQANLKELKPYPEAQAVTFFKHGPQKGRNRGLRGLTERS